ncbi:hypothetical protein [Pantoea septica]|nr:hypothetical protein [Pantoea septica]
MKQTARYASADTELSASLSVPDAALSRPRSRQAKSLLAVTLGNGLEI